MTVSVVFAFDFGSPNAYLAHLVIPEIEARTQTKFAYVPVLLGGVFKATGNRSPMEAYAGVKNKLEYSALETQRFIARHGLKDRYNRNPHFPVNTLAIMRGAIAAQRMADEMFKRYVDVVYEAMWRNRKKMDDPDVIRAELLAADLPAEDLIAAAQDPEVKSTLLANTEDAIARGVFGSPSFFVGDALYFGKDRLADVEAAIFENNASTNAMRRGPTLAQP